MVEVNWRWGSVRARTTVLASVLVGVTLVVGAIALVVTLDQSLTRNADDLAKTRAIDLASLAVTGALAQLLSNINGEGVAQVVDRSGRVLAASPNIVGNGPISTFHPTGDSPVALTIKNAPDDNETENYRVWALSAKTRDGPVSVYVGGSMESFDEASRTLRRSLTVGVPVMLAMLAFGTWLVIGRALRPVEDIRAELTTITDQALDRRVPVPKSDDEVRRLATTMDKMLDRLEWASRRQHEFVADASHELQSPLAAFRVQLEVALAHPTDADWHAIATNLLSDSDQMERLVRDLLFLAREQDAPLPHDGPIDLDDIVLQEAARVRSTTAIAIDTSNVSGAPVRGSRDDLRRLVRNVIENAVKHAGASVRLTVRCDDQHSRLDVEDDGPGVPRTDRDLVFDRFYRADAARSRNSVGTGLGLAIARAITERHHGSLRLVDSDRGAHFVLLLPVDRASPVP